MLIDARALDAEIAADVLVIGGGAAGIAIALALSEKRIDVVLLESGGLAPDGETQGLYAGPVVGHAYEPLDLARSRFLGGSTNCWGGWCRPLDDLDFERRPWIANSGWPFARGTLLSYYDRAQALMGLGAFEYDLDRWRGAFATDRMSLLPIVGDKVVNVINHLTAPARFGRLYYDDLSAATNIRLVLRANAIEIETDATAARVERVHVATLCDRRFTVAPKVVVLATGGIENARLLLLSNRAQSSGLGNGYDRVGRYFMDHPRLAPTRVRLRNQRRHRPLYDNTLELTRRALGTGRLPVAAHLAPSETWQRAARLPNSRTYLTARYFGSMSEAFRALKTVRRTLNARRRFGVAPRDVAAEIRRNLPILVPHAPVVALALFDHLVNPDFLPREFNLETVIEPTPNFESRVTLADERDQLGLRRARLDWRLAAEDKERFAASHRLVVDELTRQGLIAVAGEGPEPIDAWPENARWCWHHMGTTRMDADPKKGVVDADCRVHGVKNLFIAGSSVFPTVGSDTPTLTIVALALRIADKIAAELKAPAAIASAAE